MPNQGTLQAQNNYLRMRKTKLLLFICSLFVMGAVMAETTTDKVVISELTLNPGGDYGFFTVSLEGATTYTAYEVHFELPEGLTVLYEEGAPVVYMAYDDLSLDGNDIYPFTKNKLTGKKTYTHSLSSNVRDNELIITCISLENKDLTATSGALFHVFVEASPYLKPGDVEIAVKDVYLSTKDAKQYEPADYVSTSVKAAATSTLNLKVSASNQFGTCILPFDYALPADGSLEAYTCSDHTADALLLEKADKIAAYTPYILYSEHGFSATISGEVDANKYPTDGIVKNGHLVGTVVQTELAAATSYVMQNQGSGVKFYQVDPASPFVLAAGKCYVELPEGTASPSFRIGGTAGIDNEQMTMDNSSVIYNVLGQRVDRMTSGHVYIVNGRKVIK